MSLQGETMFSRRVQARLKAIPKLYHQKIQQKAIRGTADLILCYRGHFICWELKMAAGRLSKLQAYEIERVQRAGGIAMVVTPANLEESLVFLTSLTHTVT